MSQDWDIDEILASLDELLQEEKDDKLSSPSKQASPNATAQASASAASKTDNQYVDAAKVHVKPAKPKDAPIKKSATPPAKPVEKTTLAPPRPLDIDVPDANFRQEPSMDDVEPVLPRIVLTQDMMVKKDDVSDAFSDMLDAMEDDLADDTSKETPQADAEESPHSIAIDLTAQQVEQMVELVSIDVSYQFNQLLPGIIRKSLQTHLSMFQSETSEKQQNKPKK